MGNPQSIQRKLLILLAHLLGSLAFLGLPILFSPDAGTGWSIFRIRPFQRDLFVFALLLGYAYLNFFLLIPQLFFRRRMLVYVLVNIACLIVVTLIPEITFKPWLQHFPVHGPPPEMNPHPVHRPSFVPEFIRRVFQFAVVLLFTISLRVYNRWKEVEKQKAGVELSFLKAQINPHFLFNTLNGIYALSIERSEETPTAIVKLSGMMRYVLTQANMDYVDLANEIVYLTDYVDLQKMRLGNTVQLQYDVTGDTAGKRIAPLILIPFVENAFKHGVNPEMESFIAIQLRIVGNQLTLRVSNRKVHPRPLPEVPLGLGIHNTRNRLRLIYPGRHELKIANGDQEFIVELYILLS